MRVLHIIDSLNAGGTEKQCVELVRGLSQVGVQNAVFYFKPGPLLAVLQQIGVTTRSLPCGSFRSPRFPFRLLKLARAIRQWSPHVVQTYGFYSNLPGLPAARLAGVPIRIAGRRDRGEHLSSAQRCIQRWIWKLPIRVVANAEAIRRQLIDEEGVAPGKVVVIRNGVNLQDWPAPDRSLDECGDPIVGMVALFREQKDHMTFLRAAKEVLKVTPSVRFHLVGSGSLEAIVRKVAFEMGIADSVEFLGRLEGEALRATVRRFRVSVLSSKDNEGLPNAVLESMAAGLPVVATAVGGTPEIIDNGATGFLVPPKDPAALAERVAFLIKEPSLARSMGERGRQKVECEFSLERMVSQFHELYRDLLMTSGIRFVETGRVSEPRQPIA